MSKETPIQEENINENVLKCGKNETLETKNKALIEVEESTLYSKENFDETTLFQSVGEETLEKTKTSLLESLDEEALEELKTVLEETGPSLEQNESSLEEDKENLEESETNLEGATKSKKWYKSLGFWVIVLAFVFGGVQGVLVYFNVNFELSFVIEAVSILLCVLVYFGVLNRGKYKKENLKDEIMEDLTSKMQKNEDEAQNVDETQNEDETQNVDEVQNEDETQNIDEVQSEDEAKNNVSDN